jgi:hypothetical protein
MSWYPNITEELGRERQAQRAAEAADRRRRAAARSGSVRFRAGIAGRLRTLADRLDDPSA